MKKFLFLISVCAVCLSACKQYSNYERPDALTKGIDSLYRDSTRQYQVVKADTTNFGNTPWKKVFTDAKLQTLIQKALDNNLDLQSAELTVQQSQAALKVARLAF